MRLYLFIFAGLGIGFAPIATAQEKTCTFHIYAWNVQSKSAVNRRLVEKPYSELTPPERDARTGCSVCLEDQRAITLSNGVKFQMCNLLAERTEAALNNLLLRGETIDSVTGYRVGLTRGAVDSMGNRTDYSNHSFGIALDINADQNGLYGNCIEFNAGCKLRKGGRWQPSQPGGLHKNKPTVRALESIGLKWGGEINGRQKDFMHFSPSGY